MKMKTLKIIVLVIALQSFTFSSSLEAPAALETPIVLDLNYQDDIGWTQLMHAVKRGDLKMVEALLSVPGVNVNAKSKRGRTALMIAAGEGNPAIVKKLLSKRGIQVDAQNIFGTTALILAADEGHAEVVKLLLEAGANPNLTGKDGASALMYAANGEHAPVVFLLLNAKNILVNERNKNGMTALRYAVSKGNPLIIELFITSPKLDINQTLSSSPLTPLLTALLLKDLRLLNRILKVPGIDVNKKDVRGSTPLMFAVRRSSPEIVARLLEVPELLINAQDEDLEQTALMIAVAEKKLTMALKLLGTPGIDVNIKNIYGLTALLMATVDGNIAIVAKILATPGFDFKKYNQGNDALKLAQLKSDVATRSALIKLLEASRSR